MSPLSSFDLLSKAAAFGERRQQVLAENIAHLDTPNYKTRDLDVAGFQKALRAVAEPPSGRPTADPFTADLFTPRAAAPANVLFQDGNNRSVEREITELNKNLLAQQFAVELMSAQAATLQAVISERP